MLASVQCRLLEPNSPLFSPALGLSERSKNESSSFTQLVLRIINCVHDFFKKKCARLSAIFDPKSRCSGECASSNKPPLSNTDEHPPTIPQHLQPVVPTLPDHLSTASTETRPQLLPESLEYFGLADVVDTHAKIDFTDYLAPNEGTPTNVKPHLEAGFAKQPGFLVSTGTERSFFDLALSNPEKCNGLIVRDINPRVKAYVDFNTMLLRISKSMEEYDYLSKILYNRALAVNIDEIKSRRIRDIETKLMEDQNIPIEMKAYYLKNIRAFGEIYFSKNVLRSASVSYSHWKTNPYYEGVKYFTDRNLFEKLQRYAREGKIVATIGDINDLLFLGDLPLSVVDISNIPDYTIMDFKTHSDQHPTIIWAQQDPKSTLFFSRIFEGLSDAEETEMTSLIEMLIEAKVLHRTESHFGSQLSNVLNPYICKTQQTEQYLIASYNKKTLELLIFFKENFMLQLEGSWICFDWFSYTFDKILEDMTVEQVKRLSKNPGIVKFVKIIAQRWVGVDPEKYAAFSEVEGWKEFFYEKLAEQNHYFEAFCEKSDTLKKLIAEKPKI